MVARDARRTKPGQAPYPARMPGSLNQSWTYAEAFIPEDAVLEHARARAEEVGVVPMTSGAGAVLRLLAALVDARSVVEVGTGTGVSGVWLLRGMNAEGVLTSIDTEAEHHRLARDTFSEAEVPANRARLITGRPAEVLPRLTDAAYDLVLIDGNKQEYADHLEEALRLLRPGGVLVFDNALWSDRVADPAQRDPDTVAVRELGKTMRDHEELITGLLPVGDGLLVAVRR